MALSLESTGTMIDVLAMLVKENRGRHYSSESREKLSKLHLNPNAVYTFLRTVANPEAVEEIPRNQDHLAKIREPDKRIRDYFEHIFRFGNDILGLYLDTLAKLAERHIGVSYAQYPLVQRVGIYSNEHPDVTQFPVVHVIKDPSKGLQVSRFRNLVERLNDDEAYQIISAREAPHNYHMGEVNLLRSKGITPLSIHGEPWEVDGETLANAIEFLVQINYTDRDPHAFCPVDQDA